MKHSSQDQARVLVVAAHPDDEVLGCGGTMAWHARKGDVVRVLFLADGEGARLAKASAASVRRRQRAARAACALLGAEPPEFLGFADNRMDGLPLLEVTQSLERRVVAYRPTCVYTHQASDLNVDHRTCHQAVMTAFRPLPGSSVKSIYSFEILSSTGWASPNSGDTFRPARHHDIAAYLDLKLKALEFYADEARPFPHARSREAVLALASLRGALAGLPAAEAFAVEREVRF